MVVFILKFGLLTGFVHEFATAVQESEFKDWRIYGGSNMQRNLYIGNLFNLLYIVHQNNG